VEPIKFANGKPYIPLLNTSAHHLSSTATSHLDNTLPPFNKHDTRLRIFSGTANPALSQVITSCFFFLLLLGMIIAVSLYPIIFYIGNCLLHGFGAWQD
jgi:ribose-phosphate pyrophosphokinase